MSNPIQDQIDAGANVVPAKNGRPDLTVEPRQTIDKAEMLAVYRNDLAAIEQAAKNAAAQYHELTGKAEAFRALIAYHENQ